MRLVTAIAVCLAAVPASAQTLTPEALTLDAAIEQALDYSKSLDVAQQQIKGSEALIQQAWSLVLPTLDSSLTYTHWDFEVAFEAPTGNGIETERVVFQNQDQLDVRNTASIALFNYSAIPLLKQAYQGVDVQKLNLRAARKAIAAQTAQAFVIAIASQRSVDLALADRAYYEEHLAAETKRLEGGVTDRISVSVAKQELTLAKHRLRTAETALLAAKETLARVMGRSDSKFVLAGGTALPSLPADPEREPEALTSAALTQRESVAMAEANVDILERDVDAVWGDFLPRVDASFNHTWTTAAGFGGEANRWNIMVTATWTLFDGGLRYGELSQRRAAVAESMARAEDAKEQVRVDVLEARQRLRDAVQQTENAVESVGLAEEILASVTKLYEAGLSDYLRLFDARNRKLQSELSILRSRAEVELAQLQLLNALGIAIGPELN